MNKVTIQPRTENQRKVISHLDSNEWDYDGFEFVDEDKEGKVRPFFIYRENEDERLPYTRLGVWPDGSTKAIKYLSVEYSDSGGEIENMEYDLVSERNDGNFFE